ncbi:MAG: outer membrane protein assembly factor BamB [Rickettsiales bacterium]|jgi:outer membrane protein assembly factor BamB
MKNFLPILLFVLLSSLLTSCSSDKIIDDKNAVSVFLNNDAIAVDKNLSNTEIYLPKQILNQSWFGTNGDNNQKIENFQFSNESTIKIAKTKSVWTSFFGGSEHEVFAPLIAGETIYLLDAKGNLRARNLEDYKIIWKKRLIGGMFSKDFAAGKISYFDGKIFVSAGYNLILCISAEDGEILWKKSLSSIVISAPISDGKQVFAITSDNKTYSLNVANGEINWVHSGILKATGILGSANPVFYKNYVITSYSSGEIYSLNKDNGEAGWVYDLNLNKAGNSNFVLNDVDSTPIIKDGVVYAIGNGGLAMAIRIVDGVVLWKKELASITDFWIAGNFIYLINNDNQLICLYKRTGGIKWISALKKLLNDKKPASKIIYNGILMAGDNLLMTNSHRELLFISPLDGKILQKKKLSGEIFQSPIIVNEKIYLHLRGRIFGSKLLIIQ